MSNFRRRLMMLRKSGGGLPSGYTKLDYLEKDGNTVSNIRAVISALINDKKVTIGNLLSLLKYGGYDCHIDKEGRIAATLLYVNLYDK